MNETLPVATTSATQTIYFTSTGLEKILTIAGISFIVFFAILGFIFIMVMIIRGMLNNHARSYASYPVRNHRRIARAHKPTLNP